MSRLRRSDIIGAIPALHRNQYVSAMHSACVKLLASITIACACVATHAAPGGADDIASTARKADNLVVIDVSFLVSASPRETWDVLLDYDHMPAFLPNLQSSKILARSPTRLEVMQKGGVTHGPFTITFDVVREVKIKPYTEIVSRIVSGNLKKVDSTTKLVPEGESTRVTFHSESIPNIWVPPGIGPALIADETRDQFAAMRNEVIRRKTAGLQ
jgi:ribosome-associated toxin RatA of RatAB toxin-antitoxin module